MSIAVAVTLSRSLSPGGAYFAGTEKPSWMPTRPYIELHIAVLLAGFTGILGELIHIGALPLVWWRVALASLSFVPLYYLLPGRGRLSPKLVVRLAGIGGLVGLHWVTFYASIKLANASVAVVCFSLMTLFTALLEPWLLRKRLDWTELGLGALVVPGIALVIGVVRTDYHLGIAVGIGSALLAAVFGTLNKRYVERARGVDIALCEMLGAVGFLSLAYPAFIALGWAGEAGFWPQGLDWLWLGSLVLACTTLAFLLQMRSLRYLTAFASNLAYGLEPVYTIVLAVVLLRQDRELAPGFYLGAALVIGAIVAHPLLKRRERHRLGTAVPPVTVPGPPART